MKNLSLAAFALAGSFLCAAPALADTVSYTLTTTNPTVAAGSSVTFNGSIIAPVSNMGSVSILSDSFTSDTGYTIDDTDFGNTPFALDPGGSYMGPLFSLTTAAADMPGLYTGYFDITFGFADGSQTTLSSPFDVTVGSATSVTPEPGSWLLLSTGLAGAGLLRRRWLARA